MRLILFIIFVYTCHSVKFQRIQEPFKAVVKGAEVTLSPGVYLTEENFQTHVAEDVALKAEKLGLVHKTEELTDVIKVLKNTQNKLLEQWQERLAIEEERKALFEEKIAFWKERVKLTENEVAAGKRELARAHRNRIFDNIGKALGLLAGAKIYSLVK